MNKPEACGVNRVRCPGCGIPTIPDGDGLSEDEMLCDRCYELRWGEGSLDPAPAHYPEPSV